MQTGWLVWRLTDWPSVGVPARHQIKTFSVVSAERFSIFGWMAEFFRLISGLSEFMRNQAYLRVTFRISAEIRLGCNDDRCLSNPHSVIGLRHKDKDKDLKMVLGSHWGQGPGQRQTSLVSVTLSKPKSSRPCVVVKWWKPWSCVLIVTASVRNY